MPGKSTLIFVVTGTQAPFDRLLNIVNQWADRNNNCEIIAQTALSESNFNNMKCYDYIEPDIFDTIFNKADIIIGHAGMGIMIKALVNWKKLLVFPRLVKYNEHRNEHQLDTAIIFNKLNMINVAFSENELIEFLCDFDQIKVKKKISNFADKKLIDALTIFINNNP